MPYDTDDRLKSYLDTNQLHREQMCLAILALDKRFSQVRPRHPRGGPDGGRDIDAVFHGGLRAYGAVGFVNQAEDSEEKRDRAKRKFRSDLASALGVTPAPEVFVFFTNVNLTVGEKDELVREAMAKGIAHCEVFDRERLRIALDNPDGFSLRFQYLGIPLSAEEQASFFAKWGDDIHSLIATGFQNVQTTLDRLLFLQEASSPLSLLWMGFELDRVYTAQEIGHFRAFCSMYLKEPRLNVLSILFGSSDKADRMSSDKPAPKRDMRPGIGFGISGGQWEQRLHPCSVTGSAEADVPAEKYERAGSSSSVGMQEVRLVAIKYWNVALIRLSPILSLRDIDEAMFLPMLSRSLAQKLKRVHVYANEYKLLEVDRDRLEIDESPFSPNVPVEFSEQELADPWVRVRPVSASGFHFSFADQTPLRTFSPRQTADSMPKRIQR
ncbi:MAG: hypothetical protein FJ291_18455 [Planctomycetes bacterium]|nr:hypothetical protein [Planctomycetota bacterium]